MSDGAEKVPRSPGLQAGRRKQSKKRVAAPLWCVIAGPTSPAVRVPAAAITAAPPPSCNTMPTHAPTIRIVFDVQEEQVSASTPSVRKKACGYLLRRTAEGMRRGFGWQRETSVQHKWQVSMH